MIRKDFYYIQHEIPKDDGSKRIIQEPSKNLKLEQRYILSILQKEKLDCVFGFVVGKSIITNAMTHLYSTWSIHIDIKGFFPSISEYDIMKLLIRNKIPNHYIQIVSYNNEAPQGSPSSPRIANLIAYELDCRILGLCKKLNCIYTRYADDLVISGTRKIDTEKLKVKLIHIIQSCKFKVNTKKTLIVYGNERVITGIRIKDNHLIAGEQILDSIKYLSKIKTIRKLKLQERQKLAGLLAFVSSINDANIQIEVMNAIRK